MRLREFEARGNEREDAFRLDVDDALKILQRPLDDEERLRRDEQAAFFK